MNSTNPKELVLQTWDACRALLPGGIGQNLTVPSTDPAPLKKKETNIIRLRILPAKKHPLQFWSSAWCFYEIAVGIYGGGLTVGAVAFVQFPSQKVCGSGKYTQPTIQILEKVQAMHPADFVLTPAQSPDVSATSFSRRYFAKTHPYFPVEIAAQDMSWLIQKTLPQIECL